MIYSVLIPQIEKNLFFGLGDFLLKFLWDRALILIYMETETDASSCPKLQIMDRCPTFVDHYAQYFIQNAPYTRNRQQLPGLRPNTLRNYDNFYKN